jgi:hypothetical protein
VKTTMGPVEAARHRRGVLLPAVRCRRDPHQRPGVAGDLGLGAACPTATSRPPWPRCSALKRPCPSRP